MARAKKDYGVVVSEIDADLCEYSVDAEATEKEREMIAEKRISWLEEDPKKIAELYRKKQLDRFDLLRQYAVIVEWGSGELLENTTKEFREMFKRRTVPYWTGERVQPALSAN